MAGQCACQSKLCAAATYNAGRMLRILELEEAVDTLLKRHNIDDAPVSQEMRQRSLALFGADLTPPQAAALILQDVRQQGDLALIQWTQKLDGVLLTPERIQVSDEDIASAYDRVDSEVIAALERAAERIAAFHRRSPAQSWMQTELGGLLGQLIRPLSRIGIYIPGGSAPLASTLLMTAIPARMAGVDEVIVCAPPAHAGDGLPHPLILVAADIADVDVVYAVGGAQAIGAMAYGTDGPVAALGLVILDDTLHVQPIYAPAPVVRAEVLARWPKIRDALAPVFKALDTATLQTLNARIALEGQDAKQVAAAWLKAKGFVR